jgi:hypothetical protein
VEKLGRRNRVKYKMKMIILTLLLICYTSIAFAQTDHWFEANIYKVNNGYEVPYTIFEEDSMEVSLVRDDINPPYVSPYTSFLWRVDTARHHSEKYPWTDDYFWLDSFDIKIPIDYPQGVYEITFTHVVYFDSFWTMIDSVHTQIFDSTLYAHSTNASYIGIDTTDAALSIEMNFFEVVLINGDVVITWITQSELENCAFNLYRKEHGYEEELIKTFAGQGSTATSTTYGITDRDILQGRTYIYRLESVSCGGVHETEGRFSIFIPVIYGLVLYQNYPNPANPLTTIEFKIDEPSHVRLFIYDVNGRRSSTIIDKKMSSGSHEVNVDCSSIASGTYFYFLRAHNTRTNAVRMLSKKMTVLK